MPRITMEEANDYLNELLDGLPPEITRELNGGISLVPRRVQSPSGEGLLTLGQYHYEPYGMGRYISIYYGSIMAVYGHEDIEEQKKAFKEVLFHELTHHVESLAGIRDLSYKDDLFLEDYNKKQSRKDKP